MGAGAKSDPMMRAVAQHPYLLPPSLTVSDAAAPHETLVVLLIVFGVAVLAVLPSLGLLYTLVQRNLVEETSQPSRHPPEDTVAGV
jgi:cytochrome d ubiquinol oxidase subunit II